MSLYVSKRLNMKNIVIIPVIFTFPCIFMNLSQNKNEILFDNILQAFPYIV